MIVGFATLWDPPAIPGPGAGASFPSLDTSSSFHSNKCCCRAAIQVRGSTPGVPEGAPASTSPQLPASDKVELGHVCECGLVWETVLETYQHKLSDCWQLCEWWKIIVVLFNVLSYKAGVALCCRHSFPLDCTYLQVKATNLSLLKASQAERIINGCTQTTNQSTKQQQKKMSLQVLR